MTTYSLMANEQIEAVLCQRLEAIRLQRNITQAELAREAGVSTRTIRRLENGEGTSLSTFIRVLKALNLESRLEVLLPSPKVQPLERVNKNMRVRERASGLRKKDKKKTPWKWGDE